MIEQYKKLKEYPMYRIYNTGKIYSEFSKKFLRVFDDGKGYLQVTVFKGKNKGRETIKIHRLVAQTFIDNPNNYNEVNHIDCNKYNNKVTNLEWISREDNMKHAGKFSYDNRESLSPLSEEMVRLIPILLENKFSIKLISQLYKVGHITIRKIIQKKTWKHLNLEFPKVKYEKGIIYINEALYNKLESFNVDNIVLNSRIKRLESMQRIGAEPDNIRI